METLTPKAPQQTDAGHPRRTWLIAIIVVVVAGIAIGAWAIIEANQSDDLAAATDFADTWVEAWLTSDGDAAAALFTEDAVFEMTHSEAMMEGRDDIGALVAGWGQWIAEMQHGEVTKVDDGVFVFPVEAAGQGQAWVEDMTITFEGDLVSYAISDNYRRID